MYVCFFFILTDKVYVRFVRGNNDLFFVRSVFNEYQIRSSSVFRSSVYCGLHRFIISGFICCDYGIKYPCNRLGTIHCREIQCNAFKWISCTVGNCTGWYGKSIGCIILETFVFKGCCTASEYRFDSRTVKFYFSCTGLYLFVKR